MKNESENGRLNGEKKAMKSEITISATEATITLSMGDESVEIDSEDALRFSKNLSKLAESLMRKCRDCGSFTYEEHDRNEICRLMPPDIVLCRKCERKRTYKEFMRQAKKIIACGKKGHRWQDTEYSGICCRKCNAYTDGGLDFVWLSHYDMVSGSKQILRLPRKIQEAVKKSK